MDELEVQLKRYRTGDADALETIITRLRELGVRLLQRNAPRLSHPDRDDVVQQATMSMWLSMPHFRGNTAAELRAYFRRVLHCKVVDFARAADARRRRQELVSDNDTGVDGGVDVRAPAHEHVIEEQNDAALLHERLQGVLSRGEFEVTKLKIEGLKERDIAAILDVKIGTVATLWYRARQKLTPLLAGLVKKTPPLIRPEGSEGAIGAPHA